MNGPSGAHPRAYIGIVDEAIISGQASGLAGDWHAPRRRLDALEQRIEDDELETLDGPEAAYRLEQEVVVDVLMEVLMPAVQEDLVRALRARRGPGADLGSWSALDVRSFEQTLAKERQHEASLVAALTRQAEKPRHSYVLEAIRALEDLQRSRERRRPSRDLKLLKEEGRRLAEAVEQVLPPLARRLLSDAIEDCFRLELASKPIAELSQ